MGIIKTTLRFGNSLRELNGTQCIVVLRLLFITTKGYKAWSAKVKDAWGEVWERPGASFQSLLLVESHRTHLIPLAMNFDNIPEMLPAGKLVRDSAPRVFIGAS